MQRDITMSYEDDMMKYAPDRDKVRIRKYYRLSQSAVYIQSLWNLCSHYVTIYL